MWHCETALIYPSALIYLSAFTNLTTLPNSFSHLLRLQYLALRNCTNLSIPTYILGEISTLLEDIDFKDCRRLIYLPLSRRLRYLNLVRTSLNKLPHNLGPLDELEQLIKNRERLVDRVHLKAYQHPY